jgi:hypothetical protein
LIPIAWIWFYALRPDIAVWRHEISASRKIAALKLNGIDLGCRFPARRLLGDARIPTGLAPVSTCALLVHGDHRFVTIDFLNLVDPVHERLITSVRGANVPLWDLMKAHFQCNCLRPNFVYEALRAKAVTMLIEQEPGVVDRAINLFTSLLQTLKYRFIHISKRCRFKCYLA